MIRCLAALLLVIPAAAQDDYIRKSNRVETIRANHALHKLPDLGGDWWYCGPFSGGLSDTFPPENGVDLAATYKGRDDKPIGWKKIPSFVPGNKVDFTKLFDKPRNAVVYVFYEVTVDAACTLPLSLGSDDGLSVTCNSERLLHENYSRGAAPDQDQVTWKLKPGKNTLLIKISQASGDWAMIVAPEISPNLPGAVAKRIDRDFPADTTSNKSRPSDEGKYYSVTTIDTPSDCILEVGGFAFRSDGQLYICTRRGEIWLLKNPAAGRGWTFTKYASGLHEALGMHLEDDHTLAVVQRPELTRIRDTNKDGVADSFRTICDAWGVSGGYHEYAFGPARDKNGNDFITLNVGFGGSGQSPVPWRGWCVKVTPDGKMDPWCYGLRSPNGVTFSPDGDLFYTDNQGEWCATNKLCHLQRGKFYGHQPSLAWLKDSPFPTHAAKIKSGMLYDGQAGPNGVSGKPEVEPPAIWFPYGRMGQSASEPKWDTTAGKFGPFAGQCFVGDQTRCSVMRCALEKVNGIWQGACFPFRSGLQCGVNRLIFGPDGSLYVGQTSRGWGSIGGKPYGLQRIAFNGDMPFEVHHISVTPRGFDLSFTKPVDPKSITATAFAIKSHTYIYHATYGSPEVDPHAEAFEVSGISADGKTVSLAVPGRKVGRVYDVKSAGVRSATDEALLHAEAYYTLNAIPK